MNASLNRRVFCQTALGAAIAPALPVIAAQSAESGNSSAGPIYKAVKISMVEGDLSLVEKFKLAKAAGFEGVSLFAPDRFDVEEARRARDETGLIVHNVNNAVHWRRRLSDPDPQVRAASLEATKGAIRFAHAVGASSILQVVGKVTDPRRENHEQVWRRSIAEIRKALPLAARLGVRILCENVGNGFCEEPEEWAAYLDEIGDPWVGAFYDIGNHHSHGGADHWARTLGERIVKLDVKGHDSTTGQNCPIFAGDIDWAAVRRELAALRFTGWATAEVSGGGLDRLTQVANRMEEALGAG